MTLYLEFGIGFAGHATDGFAAEDGRCPAQVDVPAAFFKLPVDGDQTTDGLDPQIDDVLGDAAVGEADLGGRWEGETE